MNKKLKLLPQPQRVVWFEGSYTLKEHLNFTVEAVINKEVKKYCDRLLSLKAAFSNENIDIVFSKNSILKKEAYKLTINQELIKVEYGDISGLYYGIVTLKKIILQYGKQIPCVEVEDYPDIEVRGVMLDISRDKVPKLESLYEIVDMLSQLKINHFELYVEGFSFAYPSFRELWKDEIPITGEEIQKLDKYCKERFIDLVPNQNSLGHMAPWIATEQFKDLAESSEGIQLFGTTMPPSTLNPSDERSIELIKQMTDDFLPNFTSKYFNVNLDEPFELGKGKNKELADKIGIGQLYMDYVKKIHQMVTNKGKKMLMWGDTIFKHPEILPQIPKDVTVLEWGYEAESPFEEHGKVLKDSGLDFYMCPGTSSWTSIAGRTDVMLENIYSAAINGKKYGAKGILNTDWGDGGHWQCIPISYAGYSYGAAVSWNVDSKEDIELGKYLDLYVYNDRNNIMGEFSLDLGRYNQYEDFPMINMTLTNLGLTFGLVSKQIHTMIIENIVNQLVLFLGEDQRDKMSQLEYIVANRKKYDYDGLCNYLDTLQNRLQSHTMERKDACIIKDSFEHAINMIRLGADVRNLVDRDEYLNAEDKKMLLKNMKYNVQNIINEHKRLWMLRNKPGGLNRSIGAFQRLENQVDEKLKGI